MVPLSIVPVSAVVRCLALVLCCIQVLSLSACTAKWQAPVESRGDESKPTTPVKPRQIHAATRRYRVQHGDTLAKIAWQKGVDYRLLANWNGIHPPYRIFPGQWLRLTAPPGDRRSPPAKPPPTSPKAPTASRASASPQPKPVAEKKSGVPLAEQPATSPRRLRWAWPAGGRVLSTFKPSDPGRKGIRIGGQPGTSIRSAEAGKVVYSGSGLIGYGRLIIVKHNDIYLSAYGHNRKILVREGDRVAKGEKIAEMGTSADGMPLLHFEIRREGKPVDPMRYLSRR